MKYIDALMIVDNTGNSSSNEFPIISCLFYPEYQKKLVEGLLVQGNNTEKDNSKALDSDIFSYKSIAGSNQGRYTELLYSE